MAYGKNGRFITRFAMNFLPRWRGDGYWGRAVALGEQVELGWGVGSLLKIVHDLSLRDWSRMGVWRLRKGFGWFFLLKIEGLCSSAFSFKICISSYHGQGWGGGSRVTGCEFRVIRSSCCLLLLLNSCLKLWEGKVWMGPLGGVILLLLSRSSSEQEGIYLPYPHALPVGEQVSSVLG